MTYDTKKEIWKVKKKLIAGLFLFGTVGVANASPINVLAIDTTTSWDYQTVNGLTGITFTEVSSAAFGSVNLWDYDVLMVSETFTNIHVTISATNTLNALVSRENDIANWLADGHGVVAWSEPIGINPWEWLPDPIQPTNANTGYDNSVTIVDSNHAVMSGLTDEGLSGWGSSSHNSFGNIASGWDTLVTDSSGGAVTIAGTYGAGRIVLSSQDPDFHSWYNPLYYATTPDSIYDGEQRTLFAQNAIDWTAGAAPAPVPEPATMLLFGTGLVGLAGSRIRKKKK